MTSDTADLLQSRLDFIGLDDDARGSVARAQPLIEAHLGPALTRFYAKIAEVPAVTRFFDGKPQMDRAKSKQFGHWLAIATGQLDQAYMEASSKVGLRHAKIGLEPRWHIGGYGVIMETLVRGLVHDTMSAALEPEKGRFGRSVPRKAEAVLADADAMADMLVAVLKSMLLDVDIGVSAYFDKLTVDAREADDAARAKIDKAVAATGAVLRDVAGGNLTSRVTEALDPEFDQIKHDTNAVAERLTEIVGQLQQTSRSLKTATGEILSGANDLADRTTRQAATIEQTSASVEQLSTAVVENAKRAAAASDTARQLSRSATEGGAVMGEANQAMSAIETSSGKISNIIGMIDDIAFQTNLLALNASVEAARAGEAGKGFAVVAVEVRRLAQSAAQASSDVKQLIDASAGEVRNGTQLVARAAETLLDIQTRAEESAALIDTIARANKEQSQALEEVTMAVRTMDEMTQHNAALVEETNAAIEQTEGQAVELDQIVEVFRLTGTVRSAPQPQKLTKSKPAVRHALQISGNTAPATDWEQF
ncbi:globin-coupled sensor protein [Devosia sp. SD17-2]|uniref:globin-coupled sensor protein n=1 Tax=Devosia sp. SD17-2 TaxID=2976459 RepID=UPI0023D86254|nr:globin-coupled sensor protein [Devosia sp. SD17-2]WEJ35075.1 methyl-accepting chemotaxis protein [Devosia sp. SD17-2]